MTVSHGHEWTAAGSRAFLEEFELGPWSSGVLSGVTLAISDGIDIEERFTGCGNAAWKEGRVVAAKNAAAVDLLLSSGAQCLGKARVSELGFTLLGETDASVRPVNGRFPDRLTGGAAHGIASAVSCGLVDFGLGTDSGGTVLVPASNCGLTGWRSSHGIVSGAGFMPVAASFDAASIICKSPALLPSIAECLLSRRAEDSTEDVEILVLKDALRLLDKNAGGGFESEISRLNAVRGVTVRETDLAEICGQSDVSLDDCFLVFEQLFGMEAWNSLGGWVESCMPVMGDEARHRLFTARHLDRSQLPALARRRFYYSEKLSGFLGSKRFLCLPTTPYSAPVLGFLSKASESSRYVKLVMSLAAPSALAGAPQVTLPSANPSGVPSPGLSLLAAKGQDAALIGLVSRFV